MKAVIHIGSPKAGSSSLQSFLIDTAALLSGHGLQYLRLQDYTRSNNELLDAAFLSAGSDLHSTDIARRLMKAPPDQVPQRMALYTQKLDQMRAAAGANDTYVASSEHPLVRLTNRAEIEGLHRFLSERFDTVTYVIYLRRSEDFILSRYSQYLRMRGTLSLTEFARKQSKRTSAVHDVLRWVEAVGQDRIKLRTLTRDTLVGGDIITDFLDILGANLDIPLPPRHNAAFSAPAAHLLRHVNSLLTEDDLGKHELSASEILRSAVMKHLETAAPDGPPLRLSPPAGKAIRDAFGEAEEQLRAMFFPERDSLFPYSARDPKSAAAAKEQSYTAEQVADITLGAVRSLFEPGLDRSRLFKLLKQDPAKGPARIDLVDKRRQNFEREGTGND